MSEPDPAATHLPGENFNDAVQLAEGISAGGVEAAVHNLFHPASKYAYSDDALQLAEGIAEMAGTVWQPGGGGTVPSALLLRNWVPWTVVDTRP